MTQIAKDFGISDSCLLTAPLALRPGRGVWAAECSTAGEPGWYPFPSVAISGARRAY